METWFYILLATMIGYGGMWAWEIHDDRRKRRPTGGYIVHSKDFQKPNLN